MSETPKKFFSIHIVTAESDVSRAPGVYLNVFSLDGPEPHPDDSETLIVNMNFGSIGVFNIANAVKFALGMSAVPYTEEMAALHFWEPEND